MWSVAKSYMRKGCHEDLTIHEKAVSHIWLSNRLRKSLFSFLSVHSTFIDGGFSLLPTYRLPPNFQWSKYSVDRYVWIMEQYSSIFCNWGTFCVGPFCIWARGWRKRNCYVVFASSNQLWTVNSPSYLVSSLLHLLAFLLFFWYFGLQMNILKRISIADLINCFLGYEQKRLY